jgi:hypothetical protein
MTTTTQWMLVTDTLCQGVIPSLWGDDGRPVLYPTPEAATEEAVDMQEMHNEALAGQVAFLIGLLPEDLTPEERAEAEEEIREDHLPDDEPTDWAIPVVVLPGGTICAVDGTDAVWHPEDLDTLRN